MKKALLLLSVFLCTVIGAKAQAPGLMNYQAVVRNAQGQPLANTLVNLQFKIHQGTLGGSVVFTEVDSVTTNEFGLTAVQIGSRSNLGGVSWGTGSQYLQVSVDITGGTNFTDMGTTQLLSVPYALFSGNSTTNAWGLTGNSGTNPATNFIGTTDSADIKFRANNQPAGIINISSNSQSTAIGYQALFSDTAGVFNTALGYQALYSNTTGLSNAVVGNNALQVNTTGSLNSGVSAWVLSDNTTGSSNSAIGYGALGYNVTGSNNSAVGAWALATNTNGNNNTAIGNQADVADSNLTNATAIGANTVVGESNAVVIGHNASVGIGTSTPTVLLDVENGTTSPAFKLVDGTQGTSKVLTSDANGNASWQAAAIQAGFLADLYGPPAFVMANGVDTNANFGDINYINNITYLNGNIIIQHAGIYHFDLNAQFNFSYANTQQFGVNVNLNGGLRYELFGTTVNIDLKLNAGDQVTFQMHQSSGSNQTLSPFSYLDCHKVN